MHGDRGALSEEEGNSVREYKAMHKENILSRWLREDKLGNAKEVEEKNQKEEIKRGTSEVEEELEWVAVNCTRASLEVCLCLGGICLRKVML